MKQGKKDEEGKHYKKKDLGNENPVKTVWFYYSYQQMILYNGF